MPSNQELLAAVRAWVQANYPGCDFEYIKIHCHRLSKSIRLVDWPFVAAPSPPASTEAQTEQRGEDGLSPCVKAILQTLREATRPLTLTLLQEELGKRGFGWKRDVLTRHLDQLVEDGTLENPKGVRPAGYRLTPDAPPPELPVQQ